MTSPRFEHQKALACRDELALRASYLRAGGKTADPNADNFSSQLYVYERILPFDFDFYPDYTCPWHLLLWKHCRWDQIYLLIRFIESLHQPKLRLA